MTRSARRKGLLFERQAVVAGSSDVIPERFQGAAMPPELDQAPRLPLSGRAVAHKQCLIHKVRSQGHARAQERLLYMAEDSEAARVDVAPVVGRCARVAGYCYDRN